MLLEEYLKLRGMSPDEVELAAEEGFATRCAVCGAGWQDLSVMHDDPYRCPVHGLSMSVEVTCAVCGTRVFAEMRCSDGVRLEDTGEMNPEFLRATPDTRKV